MKYTLKEYKTLQQWFFESQRRSYSLIRDKHKLVFLRRLQKKRKNRAVYEIRHQINEEDWKTIHFKCYSGGWRYINRLKKKAL